MKFRVWILHGFSKILQAVLISFALFIRPEQFCMHDYNLLYVHLNHNLEYLSPEIKMI